MAFLRGKVPLEWNKMHSHRYPRVMQLDVSEVESAPDSTYLWWGGGFSMCLYQTRVTQLGGMLQVTQPIWGTSGPKFSRSRSLCWLTLLAEISGNGSQRIDTVVFCCFFSCGMISLVFLKAALTLRFPSFSWFQSILQFQLRWNCLTFPYDFVWLICSQSWAISKENMT